MCECIELVIQIGDGVGFFDDSNLNEKLEGQFIGMQSHFCIQRC